MVDTKGEGTYLLVSMWTWDHSNTEIATLTIEDPEIEVYFEEFLNHPKAEGSEFYLRRLKEIFELQRGGAGSARMIRLYKIQKPSGLSSLPTQYGEVSITMKLVPIFDFDENGNPVPHQPRDSLGRPRPTTPCEAECSV